MIAVLEAGIAQCATDSIFVTQSISENIGHTNARNHTSATRLDQCVDLRNMDAKVYNYKKSVYKLFNKTLHL